MDSDSTFHPASQLNLAFASPMTPMCVKMAALPVHLSPRTSINTLDKLRIIALIYQIKKTFRDHSSCLPTPPHGVATVETGRVAHFVKRLPNSEFATLFRLGRFHRCCLSGRTLSMKKMRILMSCSTLKGAQAAPLSLKSPHAAHHLQSLSSRPLPIESPHFRAFCSTAD